MTTRIRSSATAVSVGARPCGATGHGLPASLIRGGNGSRTADPPGQRGQREVADTGEQQPRPRHGPFQPGRGDRVAHPAQTGLEHRHGDRQQSADRGQPGPQRGRHDRAQQDRPGEQQPAEEGEAGAFQQRLRPFAGDDGLHPRGRVGHDPVGDVGGGQGHAEHRHHAEQDGAAGEGRAHRVERAAVVHDRAVPGQGGSDPGRDRERHRDHAEHPAGAVGDRAGEHGLAGKDLDGRPRGGTAPPVELDEQLPGRERGPDGGIGEPELRQPPTEQADADDGVHDRHEQSDERAAEPGREDQPLATDDQVRGEGAHGAGEPGQHEQRARNSGERRYRPHDYRVAWHRGGGHGLRGTAAFRLTGRWSGADDLLPAVARHGFSLCGLCYEQDSIGVDPSREV